MRFAFGSSLHASGALCIQCFAEAYASVHCHLNGVPFTPLIGVILEFVSCHCLLLGDMVSLRLPIRTMLSCSDGVGNAMCFVLSRLMPSQSTRNHSSPMTAMRENVATCVSVSSNQKKLSVPVLQPGCRVCTLLVLPDNALAVLFQEALATSTLWRLSPIRRRSSCKTPVLSPRVAAVSLRPSSKSSFLAWVSSGEHDAQQYCKKARAERGKRELVNLNQRLLDDWRAPNFTNRRART